ncbi:hypothetical protein M9458_056486, partial [Cirrhinus mrigala]
TIQGKPLGRGKIRHSSPYITLQVGLFHKEEIKFLVLEESTVSIILGRPWLRLHRPELRWDPCDVTRWSQMCYTQCLSKIPHPPSVPALVASTHVESPELAFTPEIPAEYTVFQDVFSKQAATHLPPHRPWDCAIDLLPGAQLPKGRVYPLSIPEHQAMKEYFKEALNQGFIRPLTSLAASSFFFVGKKDGGLRPCIDYRQLNSQILQQPYPLPMVPAALEELCGAQVFTKLDLQSAYNLVRIGAGDEWKTAFVTPTGHYEYQVMPYGLSISPSVFQTFMNKVFREFLHRFVVVYVDDILIYSRNMAEHRQHVQQVLHKLRQHNLYLKLEKCEFHKPSVHIKELQRFLGFSNFYRRFIKDYRANLNISPGAPLPTKLFNISSTSSALHPYYTIQIQNSRLWSRLTPPPLEWVRLLSTIPVHSIHVSCLRRSKIMMLNPRQARWALFFTRFNFRITYRPGSKNISRQSSSELHADPEPVIPPNLIVSPIVWNPDQDIQHATLQEPAPPESPEETAEHLFHQVFRHFGIPEEIVSNRGPQFISHVWKAFLKLLGVTVNLSSGYHPQTNGQTEGKIQELGRYLQAYCHEDQHSWSRFLPWAGYAQNSLLQDTTGLTPFQCILGYQPPLFPWTEEPSNVPAVDHWFRESERVWDSAHHHLQQAVHSNKHFANARRRISPNYQPGDLVWLSTRDLCLRLSCRKLSPRYIGPFKILRQINDVTFQLQLPPRYHIHPTFHKPCELKRNPLLQKSWTNPPSTRPPGIPHRLGGMMCLTDFHRDHADRPAPRGRGRPRHREPPLEGGVVSGIHHTIFTCHTTAPDLMHFLSVELSCALWIQRGLPNWTFTLTFSQGLETHRRRRSRVWAGHHWLFDLLEATHGEPEPAQGVPGRPQHIELWLSTTNDSPQSLYVLLHFSHGKKLPVTIESEHLGIHHSSDREERDRDSKTTTALNHQDFQQRLHSDARSTTKAMQVSYI